ncbi:hypothetical protein A2U01_0101429, partial [Trifolium medium]|nr:hypothetical protein [Trifolium medium]
ARIETKCAKASEAKKKHEQKEESEGLEIVHHQGKRLEIHKLE